MKQKENREIIPLPPKKLIVGVVGGSRVEPAIYEEARRVGKGIARAGFLLVCGGMGGVMEAACRGVFEGGGTSIGILPGSRRAEANPYVNIPIATSMSHARNAIIVRTAEIVVAIDGRYGTLSEIALARSMGKRVLGLYSWEDIPGVESFRNADEIIRELKTFAGSYSES
ncbi:MAG: TIGR00725 family protein [Elusimicrobia bacterium]|nr:TIGR00725 family protein [Elusimicrobiota bacterium]